MVNTPLDYDKIIWQVFSVGVVSSVLILYYFHSNKIPSEWNLYALSIGFAILIYSSFLVLGYGFKKKDLNGGELDKKGYPRVRWMGEIILFFLVVAYFLSFGSNWGISALILLIFILLSYIANYLKKKRHGEGWQGFNGFWKWFFKS
jgi:phosphatidylglycerophosphate synthase